AESGALGHLQLLLPDPVSGELIVPGLERRVDGFDRDAETAELILIAFELAVERGIALADGNPPGVAVDDAQDVSLREPLRAGNESEDEAEDPLFRGHRAPHRWVP